MGGESIGPTKTAVSTTARSAPTTEVNGTKEVTEKTRVRRKRGGNSTHKKATADTNKGVKSADEKHEGKPSENDGEAAATQGKGRTNKRSENGVQKPILSSPKTVGESTKGSSRSSARKRGGRKNLSAENGTENASEVASSSKKSTKRSQAKSKRKVVVRRLPPTFTEEDAKGTLASFEGAYGLFYFVRAAKGLKAHSFARFYVEFKNIDSVRAYSQYMLTATLVDGDGNPFMPVVEFAPNQTNGLLQPKTKRSGGNANASKGKTRKADYRANTLESDKDYLAFLEVLSAEREEIYNANLHTENDKPKVDSKEIVATPLLDYLKTIKSTRKGGSGTSSSDKRGNRRSEKAGTSSSTSQSGSTTKKRRERDPEKREDQKVYKVKRSTKPTSEGDKRASNKKSAFSGDLTAESSKGDAAAGGTTTSPAKRKERKRRSDKPTETADTATGESTKEKDRHTSASATSSSASKRRSNRDTASTGSTAGRTTSASNVNSVAAESTSGSTKKTGKSSAAASSDARPPSSTNKSSKSGSGHSSRSRRGGGGGGGSNSANKTSSNPPT